MGVEGDFGEVEGTDSGVVIVVDGGRVFGEMGELGVEESFLFEAGDFGVST